MEEVFLHKADIPRSCADCPFKDEYSDFPNIFCNITYEVVNDGDLDFEEERHSTCPIKTLNESELKWKYKKGE